MRSPRARLAYSGVSVMIRKCPPECRKLYQNLSASDGDADADTDQSPQAKLEGLGVVWSVRGCFEAVACPSWPLEECATALGVQQPDGDDGKFVSGFADTAQS
jgi:hypothetical protein